MPVLVRDTVLVSLRSGAEYHGVKRWSISNRKVNQPTMRIVPFFVSHLCQGFFEGSASGGAGGAGGAGGGGAGLTVQQEMSHCFV